MIDNKGDGLNKLHKEFTKCKIKLLEKIYLTLAIKCLVDEYLEECKQGLWIN